jgi:UDP-glucose 4-epimerase
VGTGRGASVREVVDFVCDELNQLDVIALDQGRRMGDPALLCADVSLITSTAQFRSKYSLAASIESALQK